MAVDVCELAQAAGRVADVLVVVGVDAQQAVSLDATLPAGTAVLWLGGAPQGGRVRPSGALATSIPDERLAAAVQALAAGLSVHEPAQVPQQAAAPAHDALTARELEVFELLAKGLNNREIAQVLGISSHTAKFHVAQILEKTGAATRTEAVRQGLRLGWIGL
jgi:DNA-binding CsgD family transcriptional regulator